MAGELASDPHSSPPLRSFIQVLLWVGFFAFWLGSADPWWRPKEWAIFSVGLSWMCWRGCSISFTQRRPASKWLSFLFGWVCAQFLLQQILPIVQAGGKLGDSPWPWVVFLQLLVIWVWFTDSIQTLTLDDFRPIAKTLGKIGVVLSGYMLLQAFNQDPLVKVSHLVRSDIRWLHGNHVIGLMGNPFQAAACLAVCVPVLVALRWHIPALLSIWALLLTESTSGCLAGLFGTWMVLWRQGRGLTLKFYSLALLCSIGYVAQRGLFFQSYGRMAILRESVRGWLTHFWAGVGLGRYKLLGIVDPTPPGYAVRWAHNEWVQLGTELGVIGLVLIFVWIYHLVQASRGRWKSIPAEWVGVGTACCLLTPLNIPWHLAPTAAVTLLFLVVWTISVQEG